MAAVKLVFFVAACLLSFNPFSDKCNEDDLSSFSGNDTVAIYQDFNYWTALQNHYEFLPGVCKQLIKESHHV